MDAKARIALLVEAQGAKRASRDVDGVTKSVGGLGDKTDRTGKRMGKARSAASSFTSSIRGMARWVKYGAAALGLFGLALGKRSLDEWREAGKVNRVTAARIRSTGKAAGLSADEISDMSASLSSLVGIDDEEIQGVANRLLTFTAIKGDTFEPALRAAIDMGAEMGNTKSAATMLGKALQDPEKGATALRRAGVNLTAQQQDQLKTWVKQGETIKAQKWILRELKTEFGGTAKAQTDGLKRAGVAWENVEESIGGVFGPALDFAGGRFANFADQKMIPLIDSIAAEMRKVWDPNSDDDLQQRLDKSGNLIRNRLGPIWGQVRRDIGRANLDHKLANAFSDAIPVIAEAAGKGGKGAVVAFARGWWKSGIWGKLITVGFLMGKFGAFAPIGKFAAKKFITTFAPQLATFLGIEMAAEGAVGRAATGKWGNLGRISGRLFGAGFLVTAGIGLALLLKQYEDEISDWIDSAPWDRAGEHQDVPGLPEIRRAPGDPDPQAPAPKTPPRSAQPPPPPGTTARASRSLGGRVIELHSHVHIDGREAATAVRQVALRDLLTQAP